MCVHAYLKIFGPLPYEKNCFATVRFPGVCCLFSKRRSPPISGQILILTGTALPRLFKIIYMTTLPSGESVCRLLEFLGHDVLRLNHVGDWGTQA
jgi:hypothetical protein